MKITNYIILLFIAQMSFGQQTLSLSEAIQKGVENSFGIKITDAQIKIAENEDTWGRAGKLPQVDLSLGFPHFFTNNNDPTSFISGVLYRSNLSGAANAQMNLYTGGRVKATKQQQELNIELQKQFKQAEILAMVREISNAYYAALTAQERIDVLEDILLLSTQKIEYQRVKAQFGQGGSFEIRQLQDAIFSDSTNLEIQHLNYENAIRNLNLALNNTDFVSYDLSDAFPSDLRVFDENALQNEMLQSNIQLKQQMINKSLAKSTTDLQKSFIKPSVNVNGGVSTVGNFAKLFGTNPDTGESIAGRFGSTVSGNVGLSLNYNIFDGGVRRSNIDNAQIQEDIADYSYEQTKLQLQNQLSLLLANYNNQVKILILNDSQLANAEENLALAEERFKVGQISSFDYRTVQLQKLNTSLFRLNTLTNLIQLGIDIDFLTVRYD